MTPSLMHVQDEHDEMQVLHDEVHDEVQGDEHDAGASRSWVDSYLRFKRFKRFMCLTRGYVYALSCVLSTF